MSLKLAVIMDPISELNYKKDSTLAMLWAAKQRGWALYYLTLTDLYLLNSTAMGMATPLDVYQQPAEYFRLGEPQPTPLGDFDIILMRKDPPFDNEYIYATYMLECAQAAGALVVNNPRSLRDCNEKFFATAFAQCAPPHLITRDAQLLREFHSEHGDVILKPLDGMGGQSIFRLSPSEANLNVIIETLTERGQQQIMAQTYLPAIKDGDKRIILINGKPVDHCLARLPAAGETRANLAAGGQGRVQPLSQQDQWITEQVGRELIKRGLIFVGLDVIGDYLTEINITSPTGIREIETATGNDIAGHLMDTLTELLAARPKV